MNTIRTTKLATALALALMLSGTALAAEGEALAKAKMCFTCHELKGENHGPSFQDIARRFSGLSNAKRMLVKEVQSGTYVPGVARHWGTMKMPKDSDREPVSQAEAEQLVDYILSIK